MSYTLSKYRDDTGIHLYERIGDLVARGRFKQSFLVKKLGVFC